MMHTLWDYTPTPAQPVAFVIAFVVACAMLWFGVKLIKQGYRDLKKLRAQPD